jgi:hypothetical protein
MDRVSKYKKESSINKINENENKQMNQLVAIMMAQDWSTKK